MSKKKRGGMFESMTMPTMPKMSMDMWGSKPSEEKKLATANPVAVPSVGGTTKKRKYRGGYYPNTPINNSASNASPYKGTTAQPRVWVGGKSRKSKRKSVKKRSCKHGYRKTCKKCY